jgi:hypothetical protein
MPSPVYVRLVGALSALASEQEMLLEELLPERKGESKLLPKMFTVIFQY